MFDLAGHGVWLWLAPLATAAVVAAAATPRVIWVAKRFEIIDRPIGLKIHKLPIPLLGGVAVYVGFLITCLFFLPIRGPVLGILAGGALAVALGVADDKFDLPPLVHLAGQVVAAVVTITAGIGVVKNISNPLASAYHVGGSWTVPTVLGVIFTLFWIVGMMNTVNFLDGLDGLSSGVGIIAAGLLAWWVTHRPAYILGPSGAFHHADLVLPIILAGALLGFLPFNWHPARVFIGDSGAMFVGLSLGAMSILGAVPKIGTALLVLSIPILDVAWAIVRRQLKGRSFLTGDKQHVYHRMLELGMSHTATVLFLYAVCVALAVVDLRAQKFDKLIAFGVVALLTGCVLVALELNANRREKAASKLSPAERPGATGG